VALEHLVANPELVVDWQQLLTTSYSSPLAMVAVALLVFPKLALGLSGFETGVAVMPLIRGSSDDTPERPRGRIVNTRKLLTTAALIMSGFLITSSFATTVLIPHQEFEEGGQASGRALAYLAHQYLGSGFGTVYDLSTIGILWFAGASAMAGLLNIVPRYLPRYGMAPEWTRAVRPLALAFIAIAFAITVLFRADVEAQAGAYATGVLVLMSSAAVAVTLSVRRGGRRPALLAFSLITLVFAYTTIANVIERPDGVKIASFFIAAILATSLNSRVTRATELRVTKVELDRTARRFIEEAAGKGELRIIANEPHARDILEYIEKEHEERQRHQIPPDDPVLFLEVTVADPSEFEAQLQVSGPAQRRPSALHWDISRPSEGTASLDPELGSDDERCRAVEVRAPDRRGDGAATPPAAAAPAPHPPPAPAARPAGRRTTAPRRAGGCRWPSGTEPGPADRSGG